LILLNVMAFNLKANSLLVRIRFSPICLMPMLVPVFVLLAYYITKPFEIVRQEKYIEKCTKKLKEHKGLIKIGITGSYGKTSVKRILCTILEEKYNVLATPSSYNTPMGICKSVKRLKPEHQVFIAEMGARHVGDIRKLAKIVEPDYAIINGIVGQHLESFGSLSAIKQTKYELVESMPSGCVAYTVDSENTISLFDDCKLKTIKAGITLDENPSVFAKEIAMNENGSTFILSVHGKEIKCHSALLGKHNISNICLAVAIAYEMGLSIFEISAGISRLTAVEHRLNVKKNANGITVIDDSYNCNTKGFDAALEVLSFFEGRKIVITPGMVELGSTEDMENFLLGKKLANACDVAVLVGRSSAYIIRNGLLECGFDPENIIQASTLDGAMKKLQQVLKAGDVILFENDLPDKFA
ncbi:MAG: UDP-N-acetylmuramoyl-tripeptide--D-alanyl-D-alanine ligase, partial [Clostridia bacterium]|nr:UDP-N-acetylmuramoyl-tripeptide--D-alanyl-D-alanine ligase [Clostridia bacterium]